MLIMLALTALLALPILPAAAAEEHRELGPHVHGQSKLDIAVEGQSVVLELTAPGMDIVGFEYPAESAADRAKVEAAKKRLADPLALFALPASARCTLASATVEEAIDDDEDEKDAQGRGHAEFHASYRLACAAPGDIRTIDFRYFQAFAGARQVNVTFVSDKAQSTFTVMRAEPRLRLP